jgi:hypothetical protein
VLGTVDPSTGVVTGQGGQQLGVIGRAPAGSTSGQGGSPTQSNAGSQGSKKTHKHKKHKKHRKHKKHSRKHANKKH